MNETLKLKKLSKPSLILGNVNFVGKAIIKNNLPSAFHLVLQRINITPHANCLIRMFIRIFINNKIIHGMKYTIVTKKNSCTVVLTNGEVFEIRIDLVFKVNNILKANAVRQYYILC